MRNTLRKSSPKACPKVSDVIQNPLGLHKELTGDTITLHRSTVESLVRASHWPVVYTEMLQEPLYQAILGTENGGTEDADSAREAFNRDLCARRESLKALISRCEINGRKREGVSRALATALEMEDRLTSPRTK
jgi:hypothetical protein